MAEHLTVTPNGIGILFEDGEKDPETGKGKKRCYKVAPLEVARAASDLAEETEHWMDQVRLRGEKYPSVTTVLGMLDKPGLIWWSERLGVEGCIELARAGGLPLDPDAALGQLTRHGLRHFQVSEQKAQRGHLSHGDLVKFFRGEPLADMDRVPEDQRGFLRGMAAFLADARPKVHRSEFMVASVEHGFAGRPDSQAEFGAHTLPSGQRLPRGLGQVDVKTHDRLPRTKPSKTHPLGQLKTPYPEHLLQVALYEVGTRECGFDATDWQGILRIDAEGNYDFTCSWLAPERALALLPAYTVFREAGARVKTEADSLPVGLGEKVAA